MRQQNDAENPLHSSSESDSFSPFREIPRISWTPVRSTQPLAHRLTKSSVRFQVTTAQTAQTTLQGTGAPCSLAEVYRRFVRTGCLY